MKISILLPYKENFSPSYAGAVSLFVKDTSLKSKFKNDITIFGSTNFKKKYNLKYKNFITKKSFLNSSSKKYINDFLDAEKKSQSDIIEIHNRPFYVDRIFTATTSNIVLFFHNDPLSMKGSESAKERLKLLNDCKYIIVISEWIKKRFLNDLNIENKLKNKIFIIPHSTNKIKNINIVDKKKKFIIFVGKLNSQKGYDIFGKVIIKILKKYEDWTGIVIGDEEREKLFFKHPNLKILGFIEHSKVISLFEKSSIAVVPSRWEEPLGRTGLEASSRGCAVIVSNKGGLPETITNGIVLKKLNEQELFKKIELLIKDKKLRKELQRKSILNFKLDHSVITKKIDHLRDKLNILFKVNLRKDKLLKILHVTNFNERHDGRLHYNTGRRINNGFIRHNHSVLALSDRDIQHNYKSINDMNGAKTLNNKLLNICDNYRPDLLILGHADSISQNSLLNLKDKNKNLKIAQWFLDPVIINGPDYEKNKKRLLKNSDICDASFLTTSPDAVKFLKGKKNFFYLPNPCDISFERLNNYDHACDNDIFFAMSHGVHRGVLKRGKSDLREIFIDRLIKHNEKITFDIYGMNNAQPAWGQEFLNKLSNSRMGLNLSRGAPAKYYSSDRIAQLMGNGLMTIIHKNTMFNDFFDDNEIVTYKNINDLSEKINKLKKDDKLAKKISINGKKAYFNYFNSNIVSQYILDKTLINKSKIKYIWDK